MEEKNLLECGFCKEEILNSDMEEYTTCKECNTSYHEECWEENSGCVNNCSDLKESDEIIDNRAKFCSNCRAELYENSKFCHLCGEDIYKNNKVKTKIKPLIYISVIVVAVGLFVFFNMKPDFNEMFSKYSYKDWCTINEEGTFMLIDTNPKDIDKYYEVEAYEAINEINEELGFSESVIVKMGSTSALDGRQTDENDKYKISWTYHPNQGLEVYYEFKK